jgi:hypothetical protein
MQSRFQFVLLYKKLPQSFKSALNVYIFSTYKPSFGETFINSLNFIIDAWTEGRQEVCRLEEEFDKDAVYHQFCSTYTANALPRKLWMGSETSN